MGWIKEGMITMGLFSREPKVLETISTEEWTKLQGRAQRAGGSSVSKEAVERRIKSSEQEQKRKRKLS
jgi:hypothetical protein